MDDHSLKERMKKLNDQYERMPAKTDVSQVMKAIEKEQKPAKQNRPGIHWPYAASFIGVLVIASILMVQFIGGESAGLLNDREQAEMPASDPEEIAHEIESHYNIRKTQAVGSLGITEEGFRRSEMGGVAEEYVSFNLQQLKEGEVPVQDGNHLKRVKENLDDMLKTPQQILFVIKGKTLTEREAGQWVKEYHKIHQGLLPIYEVEIQKYRKEWEEEASDGSLESRDLLMNRESSYSEELIRLVEGATDNGILLTYSEVSGHFQAETDLEYISFILSSSELPDAFRNVLRLKSLPESLNHGIITTNWMRAGGDLLLYEETLEGLPEGSEFLEEFEMEYNTLLRAYIKGSPAQPLFHGDGTLKEDIKESFEKMIELHPDSETVGRIMPYYQKLKENGFTEPAHWDEFYLPYER
ncbi:hypothetical protein [Rossellomorea aquimaris]|uniref:Uncharacterized protein n=1 Tax=Rossellomorea aquimaris TaxID=189382 RepID=A0A5D4TNI8_9BACI|nr:hypothetical protein [Rossellomorea aquimaris]TYS76052.1 hypothetical protein FZC80_15970 [Rossellomorea aquimaris]